MSKEHTPSQRKASHQRHQSMLEQHREDKFQARKKHREGWHKGGHKASGIPVVLR